MPNKPPTLPDGFLTVRQVADRADCHHRTVRRAIERGELRAEQKAAHPTAPYWIAEKDAMQWAERWLSTKAKHRGK